MKDTDKFNDPLTDEVSAMRRRIAELEVSEATLRKKKNDLRLIYDSIHDLITVQDIHFRIVSYNKAVEKRFGKNLKGKLCYEVYWSRKDVCPGCALKKVIDGRERAFSFQPALNVSPPVEVHAYPILNKKGEITAVIEHSRDAIDTGRAHDFIAASENDWEETFDMIPDAITIHDRDFNIIRANKATGNLLGLSHQTLLRQKCYKSYHGTDCAPAICPHRDILRTGKPSTAEMFEANLNRHIEIKALPRFDRSNHLIGAVHIVRDTTERKLLEDKLKALSFTDELTGLYNRRGFFVLAEQQLKIASREKTGKILISVDFDYLKIINDNLGHETGDQALIETAGVLRKSFRESDIIARIGGDEFVILANDRPEGNSERIFSRLKSNLINHNTQPGRTFELSLSIGAARYNPERPCLLDKLLSRADKRMYEDKQRKQNLL